MVKKMSKLLNKYTELKNNNSKNVYLIKVGIFYNSLNEDAIFLNEEIGLKLTRLGNEIIKCGFPLSALNKYKHILDLKNIKYTIIDKF